MFRKITNANELKYLDEFLLNKVGGGALDRERSGQGSHAEQPQTPQGHCPLVVFTPKPLSCGDRKARSVVPTHRRFWRSHASVCVWHLLVFYKTQLGFP